MAIPESVALKIFRAKEHYNALIQVMNGQFKGDASHIVIKIDVPSKTAIQTFSAPIPTMFPLIVGDCLDNLRSALDFMVWELVLAADGVPSEKNAFAICDCPKSFKDASRSRFAGLTPAMVTEIDLMQPYHRGDLSDHPLWLLNKLANVNKHRRIILVEMRVDWAGKVIGTEHYTVTRPDSQMHVDIHPVAYVALNEREILDGTPDVSAVLSKLISEVELLMTNFERFF